MTSAVQVAEQTWWVGSARPEDTFQCHSYLIPAGDQSALIDPGSALTIAQTLDRVAEVVPVESVRWLICHHSDPDIAGALPTLRAAMPREDLRVVTEWRAETLLRHYAADIPFYLVEEHGWTLELDGRHALRFVLTPYLHFPGAMVTYDESTGVLFSSDLFGGFSDGRELFAKDESYFELMRPFHEHYMPSREILDAGLDRIRRTVGPIRLIAPQHGCLIPQPLVAQMFEQLSELECGIFLMARDDLDIARLLRVANAWRRTSDALLRVHGIAELAAAIMRVFPDVLPIVGLEVYAAQHGAGTLRFAEDNRWSGVLAGSPAAMPLTIDIDIPGDGPPASLRIILGEPVDSSAELGDMFTRLGPLLRAALDRHLEQRQLVQQQDELRESAIHDPLTGLYNRRALSLLVHADQPFGVLMIDIDHFKAVNDRHGHVAGDTVLEAVAATIVTSVRTNDIVVRYGGEEVLVLLIGADRELIASVAERIRLRVGRLEFSGHPDIGRVTVSIGAAVHHRGQPIDEAVADADRCLYRAKHEGRDRVSVAWTPVDR